MSWLIRLQAGPVLGPADDKQVRQWAAEGRIGSADAATADGRNWKPLAEVPLFRDVFPPVDAAEAPAAPNAALMMMQESIVWKEMARERDEFARQVAHWRTLYEEAQETLRRVRQELETRIRELESGELMARTELEHARRDVDSLRKQVDALSKPGQGDEVTQALINGYHTLSRNFAHLSAQIESKDRDIREGREMADTLRRTYEERVRSLEAQLAMERELAMNAQRRFAGLEGSYQEMVKSLREMNDRYISMRDRLGADASSGAPATPKVRLNH